MTHRVLGLSLLFLILSTSISSPLLANEPKMVALNPEERAFLEAHPKIVLGTDSNWEPYVKARKDGSIDGFDAEILDLVNKYTGANFTLKLGEWPKMIEKAKRREIDGLSTGAVHDERRKYLNFSDVYVSMQRMVIVLRGNPLGIKEWEDLKGKTIVLQKGHLYDEKMAKMIPEATIRRVETFDKKLKALVYGKADAAFGNAATMYSAIRAGISSLQYAFAMDDKIDLVFSLRNDWPEALSIMNKGLQAIPKEERRLIYNKWFGAPERRQFDYILFFKITLPLTLIAAVFAFLAWHMKKMNKRLLAIQADLKKEITERKRMVDMYRNAELRYHTLFEESPYGILLIDAETGKIIDANETTYNQLGYTREEFFNLTVSDYEMIEKPVEIEKHIEKIIRDGSENFETLHRTKSGEIRNVHVWSKTVQLSDQFLFFAIYQDITDQRKAEKALIESEQRYRTVVEDQTEIISRFKPDGTITFVNDVFLRFFDKSREDLLGNKWQPVIYSEDLPHVEEKLRTLSIDNQMVVIENRVFSGDGTIRWLQFVNRGFYDENGHLVGIQSVGRDITELKLADEQIKASLKEKEVLLREIHHRVKNNLAVVISLLNLQARQTQNDRIIKALQESRDRIKAMSLIHEELYRSENLATISLKNYTENLCTKLLKAMKGSGRKIRVIYEIEDIGLNIDQAIPCGLILNELMTNAIKYAFPKGKGEIRVSICNIDSNEIELVVHDNGVGLTDGVDLSNPESLGLNIVSILAKNQLEGRLDFRNDKGARFSIRWPAAVKKEKD